MASVHRLITIDLPDLILDHTGVINLIEVPILDQYDLKKATSSQYQAEISDVVNNECHNDAGKATKTL